MLAMVATIATILALGAMVLSAMRTYDIVTPTNLYKCLLADFLIVEVIDY